MWYHYYLYYVQCFATLTNRHKIAGQIRTRLAVSQHGLKHYLGTTFLALGV